MLFWSLIFVSYPSKKLTSISFNQFISKQSKMNCPQLLDSAHRKNNFPSFSNRPLQQYDKLHGKGYSHLGLAHPNRYKQSVISENKLNQEISTKLKSSTSTINTESYQLANSYRFYNNHNFYGYHNDKNIFSDPINKRYGTLKQSLTEGDKNTGKYFRAPKRQSLGQIQDSKRRVSIASMSLIEIGHEEYITDDPQQKLKASEKERLFMKTKTSQKNSESKIEINKLASLTKQLNRRSQMKKSDYLTENWKRQSPSCLLREGIKKFSLKDFEKIKVLGSGKYGEVFLAKQKSTNMLCALKIIQKKVLREQQITEQFTRELKIQLFLNHPNIIKMYGFFDDSVNIYIILEAAIGGELFKKLGKKQCLSEKKVAKIMRQVCLAVAELHSHSIIHRDIKPQNIVMHENIVKLCDFGWSVHQDQNLRNTFCGTPLYVCPQIIKGIDYDEKIDLWSLGVMMYEMLIGENPFKIAKQEDMIKIVTDRVVIPSNVKISSQAENFLFCCLQKSPNQRKSIDQLINHEFFQKFPENEI